MSRIIGDLLFVVVVIAVVSVFAILSVLSVDDEWSVSATGEYSKEYSTTAKNLQLG